MAEGHQDRGSHITNQRPVSEQDQDPHRRGGQPAHFYPPPPQSGDDRYRQNMAQPITLPSLQGQFGPPRDPRQPPYSGSPTGSAHSYNDGYGPGHASGYANGYPSGPTSAYPQPPLPPNGAYHLPPVGAAAPARYPPPPDGRADYYPHPQDPQYAAYANGQQYQGYSPQGGQQQSAPRQRTAIACRYCRKRKIRCSGFNSTGGKCSNCRRSNHECIFQPVNSATAPAFVSVEAFQGNIPTGTQVFGAFGQPLAPSAASTAGSDYSMASPTATSFHDGRPGDRRPFNEPHQARLPPPNAYAPDGSSRTRSPASYGSPHSPNGSRQGDERRETPPEARGTERMRLSSLMEGPSRPGPPDNRDSRDPDSSMLARLNQRRS